MTDTTTPRPAIRHATFTGDKSGHLGRVFGPDARGIHWTVVDVVFDPDAGTTRVGYALAEPDDYAADLAALTRALGIRPPRDRSKKGKNRRDH